MGGEKSMNELIVVSMISVLLLAGCSTTKELEITTTPIDKPALVLPNVDELNLTNVDWFVINEENVEEVWQRLSDENKDIVLFGLTDDGYEALAINLSDIMTLVQQQKAIIVAYKDYYEDAEKAIDDANAKKEEADKAAADKKWYEL
tara:strand:+ start:897 stop:1337 length:441 start_codon:yes stop_codon:yes gene_type:complete